MLWILCDARTVSAQLYKSYTFQIPALYSGEPFFLAYWADPLSIKLVSSSGDTSGVAFTYYEETGEAVLVTPDGNQRKFLDVQIVYKAIPLPFLPVIRPPGYVFLDSQLEKKLQPGLNATSRGAELFGNSDLRREGSVTRGIIAGTRRDFAIESGLRFEMSGRLAENVTLFATLTDQSTPIQPDGSTQNIREFDQVLIKIQSPGAELQMGDVDIVLETGEFARLRRRLQGASGSVQSKNSAAKAGLAVPRGKFRSQQFNGIDGVQGPYRLNGELGEQFIVVLAGSEKVYLDGLPLLRGEDHDYVIDYGIGEIRFTSKRVITDFSRITVDFQYQNTEYARTVAAAQGFTRFGNRNGWFTEVTVIREADNEDVASGSLSTEDVELLRQAGNVEAVSVSGVSPASALEIAGGITYARKDSVVEGSPVSYYKTSKEAGVLLYSIRFGRKGPGLGSYNRVGHALNGIAYEYAGEGKGEYDTLRTIRAPQNNRMAVVRSGFEQNGNKIEAEMAANAVSFNRISEQASPHLSRALAGNLLWNFPTSGFGTFSVGGRHRNTDKNITYFDRTLDIEFTRKWDISAANLQSRQNEQISETEFGWRLDKKAGIAIKNGWYKRGGHDAERKEGRIELIPGPETAIWYRIEDIESRSATGTRASWTRHLSELKWTGGMAKNTISPRIYVEAENRTTRLATGLQETGFQFIDLRPSVGFSKESGFSAALEATFRSDQSFDGGQLRPLSFSQTLGGSLKSTNKNGFETALNGAYRKRDFSPWFETNRQREDTDGLLLNAVQTIRPSGTGISAQFFYDLSTERRARFQETYVEIGPELGQFVWTDLNGDSIQQIAEFFPEITPNEGTFVKQWIPSDNLQPVVNLQTRIRFLWEPARSARFKTTLLRHINVESAFDIRENSTNPRLSDLYLVRTGTFLDSVYTLQGRNAVRHKVQFFPSSPEGSFSVVREASRSLNNQTSGAEHQYSAAWRFESRYRVTSAFSLTGTAAAISQSVESASFDTRNFDIQTRLVEPGFSWSPVRGMMWQSSLSDASKSDDFSGAGSRIRSARQQLSFSFAQGLQGSALLQFRSVEVTGNPGASGAFELTEGAGAGNSCLWSLQAAYRINSGIRSSISYDGRTVPSARAVHTLRFVVNAIF